MKNRLEKVTQNVLTQSGQKHDQSPNNDTKKCKPNVICV